MLASITSFFGGSKADKSRPSYDDSTFARDYSSSSYLPSVPPISRGASPFTSVSRSASFDDASYGYNEVGLNTANSYPPQASHYTNGSSYAVDGGLHSPHLGGTSPFASPASTSRARLSNGGPYIDAVSPPAPSTSYPSLRQTFARIAAILGPSFPELLDTLGNPCLAEDATALGDVFGRVYTLPRDVRDSLACHDGQDIYSLAMSASYRERQARGLCFGLWLMSSDEIADDYRHWRLLERKESRGEVPVDDPFAQSTAARAGLSLPGMHSCPAGWVREEYSHPGWVPLLTDGLGNYIGVDLDPPATRKPSIGPGDSAASAWGSLAGRPGQVIAFGRDIDCKTVLFPGWGPDGGWARFLSSFADDLESGDFAVLGGQRGGPSEGGDEDSFDESDGLGDVDYLDEGAGTQTSSFAEGRPETGRRRNRSSTDSASGGGWRLRGEYRDLTIIEALCARSRRRWTEVGLEASDRVPRRASVHYPEPTLQRRESGATVRPPSPNLMVVDPVKPAPIASTSNLSEPSPLSPRLTFSPPSPERARMPSAIPAAPVARRRPPPPVGPVFLPTMADLDTGYDMQEATEDLEAITTASPRISAEGRRNSRQLPDVLPRSVSPRPPSSQAAAAPPTPTTLGLGLGISDEAAPIEVVVQQQDGARGGLRPAMPGRSSTDASSVGSGDYVEASDELKG
jgi:cell wall assembly regulator SMI1